MNSTICREPYGLRQNNTIKMFSFFSAGLKASFQKLFIHNIMTVKYLDTDELSCKYTANFVASWEICEPLKGLSCAFSTSFYLKLKVQSKVVVFKSRARMCVKKQATPTRDGSQLVHNVSTKVSSVTGVYVQRQCVRVCVCVLVGFFCHFVLKRK